MKPIAAEKKIRRQVVYQGRVVNLFVDEIKTISGRRSRREIVDHVPAVAVVPLLPKKHVLLIQQYRYAIQQALWEIPAGLVEKSETPLQAARRELREETGYQAGSWHLLGRIFSSPGFTCETIHLYVADGLHQVGPPHWEVDEFLHLYPLPFAQALNIVRRRAWQDGKTFLALLLAAEYMAGKKIRSGFR